MNEPLVHGVGAELVPPDWPALTLDLVSPALAAYGLEAVQLRWNSPRPLSAAALVDTAQGEVFVKRHSISVRTPEALSEEHKFSDHLRSKGFPVPAVLRTLYGESVWSGDGWTWEVFQRAAGQDTYRDSPSWDPFLSATHAFAAGAALARLQVAATDFDAAARPPHLLVTSAEALLSPSLETGLNTFVSRRPPLQAALDGRNWRDDLAEALVPLHTHLVPHLNDLPSAWTHGDGHASNLFWTAEGEVAAVIDFGLADRTTPILDLATALERNVVQWLAPQPVVRLDLAEALIDGWQSVRPLTPAEAAALPWLFALVHTEFALSELAYFHGVTHSAANAEAAYETYLLGHARWHAGADGQRLRRHLHNYVAPR